MPLHPLLALALALPLACPGGKTPRSDDSADGGSDGAADGGDGGHDGEPAADLTVVVDPDVVTLLDVHWTQQVAADGAWLEFTDAEGEWRSSPVRALAPGEGSEVVIGVPADTDTTVRLVEEVGGSRWQSEDLAARTGTLPEPDLQPQATVWDPLRTSEPGYILGTVEINSTGYYWGPFWLFLADRQGRIIWYDRQPDDTWTLFPRVARDGSHILLEHARVLAFGSGEIPDVERRSLDGSYDEVIPTDDLGFTYEELPDGSLLFDDYADWPEVWLTQQAPDGSQRRIWDCMAWMGAQCTDDFCCSVNAIQWIEDTDTVLWSMWESDDVVELDHSTGAVLRHFGALSGAWTFDPPDAGFDKQHWPNFTPDGQLLVSTHTLDGAEQRFREYEVDAANQTLHQVWSYGEGEDLFAIHHGEAVRLDNGNTLLNYGTDGVIRELDPQGEIAWELDWNKPYMLGHNTQVSDPYALNAGPTAR